MLIGARNGMLVGGQLPYKKRIQYIESTRTQYIDTGVVPTADTITDVLLDNYQFSRIEYLFGVYDTDYRTNAYHAGFYESDIRIFVNGAPALNSYIGNYRSSTTHGIIFPTAIQSIRLTSSNVSINGTVYGFTQNPNVPLNISHSMFLFGCSNAGVFRNDRGFTGRVKSCKIFSSTVTVRDFIPVIDLNDEPKMFDLVTQTYPTHYGTFIAGPDL